MNFGLHDQSELRPETQAFYCRAMDVLAEARVPFLVGGAYALARYTGMSRHTKDFDVFLRPADCQPALAAFARHGYRTELTFPHWLAKVYGEEDFIDLIFSSGNGLVRVDDGWFTNAVAGVVLDRQVRLCPVEEIIWSKAFVMERERYDGADIMHLLRGRAADLDWSRLIDRFGEHWRLLLSYVILFGYVYPAERMHVPADVLERLLERLEDEQTELPLPERVCRGTLLSRSQYLMDIEQWGYQDARLPPLGPMTPDAVAHWTASIGNDHPSLEH
jgi:hypothetical protein